MSSSLPPISDPNLYIGNPAAEPTLAPLTPPNQALQDFTDRLKDIPGTPGRGPNSDSQTPEQILQDPKNGQDLQLIGKTDIPTGDDPEVPAIEVECDSLVCFLFCTFYARCPDGTRAQICGYVVVCTKPDFGTIICSPSGSCSIQLSSCGPNASLAPGDGTPTCYSRLVSPEGSACVPSSSQMCGQPQPEAYDPSQVKSDPFPTVTNPNCLDIIETPEAPVGSQGVQTGIGTDGAQGNPVELSGESAAGAGSGRVVISPNGSGGQNASLFTTNSDGERVLTGSVDTQSASADCFGRGPLQGSVQDQAPLQGSVQNSGPLQGSVQDQAPLQGSVQENQNPQVQDAQLEQTPTSPTQIGHVDQQSPFFLYTDLYQQPGYTVINTIYYHSWFNYTQVNYQAPLPQPVPPQQQNPTQSSGSSSPTPPPSGKSGSNKANQIVIIMSDDSQTFVKVT